VQLKTVEKKSYEALATVKWLRCGFLLYGTHELFSLQNWSNRV